MERSMSRSKIETQLKEILELELSIEERLWDNSFECKDLDGVCLDEKSIQEKVDSLAEVLIKDYPKAMPVLVSVMDGALPFTTKLFYTLNLRQYHYQYAAMLTSSYTGLQSTAVKIGSELKVPVGARHVIIIDEVCDSGETYGALRTKFLNDGALTVELMALIDKIQPRSVDCNPKYKGFTVSKDAFLIGLGLDYHGFIRNMPSVRIVDPATLPTDEEKKRIGQKKSLNEQLRVCIKESNVTTRDSFFSIKPTMVNEEQYLCVSNNSL